MSQLPPFQVPPLKLEPKRQAEIPFRGTVGAGVFLTLVSGLISYPFRIIQVKMIFTDVANHLVEHRWFVDTNINQPTTGFPTGQNLFSRESPSAGFRGKALIRVVPCNLEFPDGDLRIILGTQNLSNYAYIFDCSCTIQEL